MSPRSSVEQSTRLLISVVAGLSPDGGTILKGVDLLVDTERIKLLFECEDHPNTTQDCSPLDLVLSGVPMCPICNEEMSVESHAEVNIPEVDKYPYGSKTFRMDDE